MKRLNTAPILQIEIPRGMLRFWSVIWVLNGWSILVPAMGPFKVAANYVIYISLVFCVHKYIINYNYMYKTKRKDNILFYIVYILLNKETINKHAYCIISNYI